MESVSCYHTDILYSGLPLRLSPKWSLEVSFAVSFGMKLVSPVVCQAVLALHIGGTRHRGAFSEAAGDCQGVMQ